MTPDSLTYGIRPVIEAIQSGKEIERIFIQQGLNNSLINELKALLKKNNIIYQAVPAEKLNRLTRNNHQGVVCFISEVTYYKIEDVVPQIFEEGKIPLLVMLDRVTDVRNFGAIARTAECAGVDAIVIPSKGAAQINSDAIKTSAGALHRIKVCRENNLKEVIEYLKESGIAVIGCTEKTADTIYTADFSLPVAIIMGSEEDGISGEYLKRCDAKVKIPMAGKISSLNVSVAAGIVLFEAIRQRNFK
ncbi:MAG TPA: 23S rRNA (guanosine(2251)-2'-O)-methyltransferase RlmB [Bacteroidia bacterium]|nr:23S rRNA (guanosine(2251)-2'-O)-methyltransferase RlmB [Bacteroidia bacterium]